MKTFKLDKYQAYVWKGINQWNKKSSGVIIAKNDDLAVKQSETLGVSIQSLKKRSLYLLPRQAAKNIEATDITFIIRQLSTLIAAGIPLTQALEIMAEGNEKVQLRALLLSVRDELASGKSLTQSLEKYSDYFNHLICGLVSAGEASGALEMLLNQIATYLEHQQSLRNRVKKSLYYPVTVLIISTMVSLGILLFLVPQFEEIYKSFDAPLPALTQRIVDFSHFLKNDWFLFLIGLSALYFSYIKLKKKSIAFAKKIDLLKLKTFIFGRLIQQAIIARTTMTLAITITAGVPLIEALKRVSSSTNNLVFEDAYLQTKDEVSKGEHISNAMRKTQLFPATVIQMINVGEKSGSLDKMLQTISNFYTEQVNTAADGLSSLLEPILILFLAVLVGFFVVAMYLPIFNLGMAMK